LICNAHDLKPISRLWINKIRAFDCKRSHGERQRGAYCEKYQPKLLPLEIQLEPIRRVRWISGVVELTETPNMAIMIIQLFMCYRIGHRIDRNGSGPS
jgi:hypothetical protein